MEYWLAALFGRVWLRLRPGLQPKLGELPAGAKAVARGSVLPAGRLLRVQDFAARIWSRFAIVSILLIAPVIAVVAVINPGPWGTRVAVDIGLVFVGMAAVAAAQTILLRYRSHRTDAFVLRNLADWDTTPLPVGSLGLPRRSDFWLATGIAVVVFAVMIYASIQGHLQGTNERARWYRAPSMGPADAHKTAPAVGRARSPSPATTPARPIPAPTAEVADFSFAEASLRDAVVGTWHEGERNVWRRVDFSRADFRVVAPLGTVFDDCDFSGARLAKVRFEQCAITHCRFPSTLTEVVFDGRPLEGRPAPAPLEADFTGAAFDQVEFLGLDLSRVTCPQIPTCG